MDVRTLKVPGATLHYEVRGAGPVLLLICGGVYDAAGYAGLAGLLADRYTVVTYDRRGNSRSPLDGAPEPQRVEDHVDDASRVLREVGGGPAHVFGNSAGATIALGLAARHPEQVRTVVAHEPPFFTLLPDAPHWRSVVHEVKDVFAESGADAAMARFGALTSGDGDDTAPPEEAAPLEEAGPPQDLDAETLEMFARFQKNADFFFPYEVSTFARASLDEAALRSSGVRIVLVAGEASEGQPAHRAAHIAAERLGTRAETWPGDHGGFGTEAEAFATRLNALFAPAGG
ncbi:alpha/beta fold hydrolase [Actinomadura sp. NEAU-AAG7]|uniref:alpha/beta fold hydrolase n=1 Tax=Actinomadura sp. NEAU-AAG7 TaxID=2839640 RepID=UPI001BE3E9FF|nr:alpha/beta hydrolase [Actinomadura sp. NEAU-AAG7]MBT2208274.1 alpha/beta hydrolase [Actinomadura sp. NEAU-AAG7]